MTTSIAPHQLEQASLEKVKSRKVLIDFMHHNVLRRPINDMSHLTSKISLPSVPPQPDDRTKRCQRRQGPTRRYSAQTNHRSYGIPSGRAERGPSLPVHLQHRRRAVARCQCAIDCCNTNGIFCDIFSSFLGPSCSWNPWRSNAGAKRVATWSPVELVCNGCSQDDADEIRRGSIADAAIAIEMSGTI
ncbi:hypothetical protein BD626DRAFT_482271 [Schizophyllum amplum]|uniref:Uncharacterized protein n=1 Tax=Schizophyllum amplum TaxID=97359 RepID=A0A550CV01_9AGAR|nr:hypothetical protein BD626DRAFT_482271 [Auriculariopsis ampla]